MTSFDAVSPIEPGLIVLHSNRMEMLRDLLVRWLEAHPLAPLESDIVTVQSNGIAQWLRSTLARNARQGGLGIAAALETPMPSRLLWSLYRRVLGETEVPPASPLDEQPLTWRLMRLLGRLPDPGVYRPLIRFLDDDLDLRKRYQLAQRLADLFDQYQVYRADWLADWAMGKDQLRGRGEPRPLDPDQCWQAALWRDILADVGEQAADAGRAGVHERFIRVLREWPEQAERPDLPRRIVVFGLSSLPRQSLEALIEVARWVQVLVCVHNPCEYHWADIVEGRALLRNARHHQSRKPGMPLELDENCLHAHAHPLLASWGKQGRDYIALLEELEEASSVTGAAPVAVQTTPVFLEVDGHTLLAQLQDDIRALRSLEEVRVEQRVASIDEQSVQFHIAHSALREVEILHDRLLAAFDADPTLEPDDVIVMVPDIEKYAAYVDAVFGLHGSHDMRHIPYFIVDRGPGRANTVADALHALLSLPLARMGVGEVLDLLDIAAFRCRFDLAEEDIAILRDWIQDANVRWGLDADHRRGLGLPLDASLAQMHTWVFGMRRMLLGYAIGESGEWNGVVPHGDVSGLSAGLVGVLAHVIDRLLHYARELAQPASPTQWILRLRALLDDFLLPPDDLAAFTIEQLRQELDIWEQECEDSGFNEEITLPVVQDRWLSCLKKAGLAQRFTSGAVTFATLMPMRAIPFRHVCLLGMNDRDYPRPRTPSHFDLMEKDYRPGDRSRRDDDRYLLLEALLSARERFYISWVGRSAVDNAPSPPSVLVGQLRDHIAAVWSSPDGHDVLDRLTTEHPLQGFSQRYFSDASPAARLFTYGREWRSPEQNGQSGTSGSGPLEPAKREEPLTVSELRRFLEHPVKEFFRQRLQVSYEEEDAVPELETFHAGGLENWQLRDTLIQAARRHLEAGADPFEACRGQLKRMEGSGALAFGAAGQLQAEQSLVLLESMFDTYRQLLLSWPNVAGESLEIRHTRAGTPGLSGWLHGLRQGDGDEHLLLHMQASNLTSGTKQEWRDDKMLGHWVQHLAGNSMGLPLRTIVVSPAGVAELAPVQSERAMAWLGVLLDAWVEGMRRPLPVKAEFAHDIITAIPADFDADSAENWQALLATETLKEALANCFRSKWNRDGREEALYESRAFPTLESLTADGELPRWVLRLYRPLFIALRNKEAA
ncbi:MAG TPA: exodeoxyribonuclease V subunit gamma [Burkholderiaceae bacterium]|nr:exodeoxyribonuclease V subunit gamma [Burkholderiaceae bacterium]